MGIFLWHENVPTGLWITLCQSDIHSEFHQWQSIESLHDWCLHVNLPQGWWMHFLPSRLPMVFCFSPSTLPQKQTWTISCQQPSLNRGVTNKRARSINALCRWRTLTSFFTFVLDLSNSIVKIRVLNTSQTLHLFFDIFRDFGLLDVVKNMDNAKMQEPMKMLIFS